MTAGTVHGQLTADGQRILLLATGEDDQVRHLAKMLATTTPNWSDSKPANGTLSAPATWATVVQLGATFGAAWQPLPELQAWIQAQAARRTAALPDTLNYTPPAPLAARAYQVDGAALIAREGRVLIFDEPRVGKTVTAVLGLAERAGEQLLGGLPILVICPASVVDPWVRHFRAWVPGWKAVAWRGTPLRRRALLGTADVYVASYETARMDAKDTNPSRSPLIALGARSLVVDEVHQTKNSHAARTAAVKRLAAIAPDAFIALSGTPITHHPADLWPALNNLTPGAWGSRERWIKRYCLTVQGDYKEQILGLHPGREPEYRLTVLGQHRRVARADVMSQLPPKVYSIRTVELPPAWRKTYDAMESQMIAELPDGGELSAMGVLAQLTRLSQLASAATDVITTRDEKDVEHVEVKLKAPSWKVDALLEILAERPGEQNLVFAPSRQLIKLAGAAAEQAGYRVGYVIGGQAAGERTATVDAFQAGGLDVLLATTGAGGTGLTLSAAGTLIFLQRPWSLVESLQAEDRAEGDQNATRGTEIIDVVAANTVDTRIRAVLRERAGALAEMVVDPRILRQILGGDNVTRTGKKTTKAKTRVSAAA